MSTDSGIKITPEVRSDDCIQYLIRVDGEELAFVENEKDAILVVDSLAAEETRRLTGEWTKVYREDLQGGRKVVLSTQYLGRIVNGSITPFETIDMIPVGHVVLIRGRHERSDEEDLNTSPIVPLPEFLEKLGKARLGETSHIETTEDQIANEEVQTE